MNCWISRLAFVCTLLAALPSAADEVRLMVLDFQLNDLTGLPDAKEELARVNHLSATFHRKLAERGVAVMPASEALKAEIAANSPTYLFDRVEYAARLAEPSGADYLLIGVALKPTYLFVYPRILLVDIKTRQVALASYAQLESSWSDENTTARTADLLAGKVSDKLQMLANQPR